ncbi:cyclin-dependent kinase inhibitor 4-like [Dorcoceras hygrometricum]|uniref:Cyclin-dependent kinase inhibitor 4-like n=1 Tax=Dorcoceras hygrometricum TaxID=472368 RepID=A0A2Z7CX07_9LAMI|nr:cyclin-dependent kinase inhibitor 4-like [Dorcoceras hygrometricum]
MTSAKKPNKCIYNIPISGTLERLHKGSTSCAPPDAAEPPVRPAMVTNTTKAAPNGRDMWGPRNNNECNACQETRDIKSDVQKIQGSWNPEKYNLKPANDSPIRGGAQYLDPLTLVVLSSVLRFLDQDECNYNLILTNHGLTRKRIFTFNKQQQQDKQISSDSYTESSLGMQFNMHTQISSRIRRLTLAIDHARRQISRTYQLAYTQISSVQLSRLRSGRPYNFSLGCSIQLTKSKSVRDALRSHYKYSEQLMMAKSADTAQISTRQQISSRLLIPTKRSTL